MSHEVLITRRQSIGASEGWCWLLLNAEAASSLDLQKNKNALSSGYQDLMGHLILTTSP